MDPKILYKEDSYKIVGACMKVHRGLGSGFFGSGISRGISEGIRKFKDSI